MMCKVVDANFDVDVAFVKTVVPRLEKDGGTEFQSTDPLTVRLLAKHSAAKCI